MKAKQLLIALLNATKPYDVPADHTYGRESMEAQKATQEAAAAAAPEATTAPTWNDAGQHA